MALEISARLCLQVLMLTRDPNNKKPITESNQQIATDKLAVLHKELKLSTQKAISRELVITKMLK